MPTTRTTTRLTGILASAMLIAVTAACGSAVSGAAPGASAGAVGGTGASDAAAPGSLVLYSSMGFAKPAADVFTKKTGIQVKLVYDSGGPLLTKVSAERNNPQWTALWIESDLAFTTLDQGGLLATYTPNANYNDIGRTLVPSNHAFAPVSSTTMAALLCNAVKVPNPPAGYQDLLGEAYKGEIGMNDPSQSGPTYTFIAGIMQQLGGEEQGKDFFAKLKANGLQVFPTNGDTVHALETGQIQCGLIQSSTATGEILKVPATDTFKPVATYLPTSTLLPGVIGISSKASGDSRASAQKFEDYILSPEGQQVLLAAQPQGSSLFWPVITGVNKLDALAPMPTSYQRLDPTVWGPKQGEVVTWFSNTIK